LVGLDTGVREGWWIGGLCEERGCEEREGEEEEGFHGLADDKHRAGR
jgi:hypothetical protein